MTSSLKYYQLYQVLSTLSSTLNFIKYSQLYQVPSTLSSTLNFIKYPQLYQVLSTLSSALNFIKYPQLYQVLSTLSNTLNFIKCSQLYQVLSTLTGEKTLGTKVLHHPQTLAGQSEALSKTKCCLRKYGFLPLSDTLVPSACLTESPTGL